MDQIKQLLNDDMRVGVEAVLKGEEEEYKNDFLCPNRLISHLRTLGFECDYSTSEINGWQGDWWIDATKDGVKYTVAGSAYYGGVTFHKADEED